MQNRTSTSAASARPLLPRLLHEQSTFDRSASCSAASHVVSPNDVQPKHQLLHAALLGEGRSRHSVRLSGNLGQAGKAHMPRGVANLPHLSGMTRMSQGPCQAHRHLIPRERGDGGRV